MPPKPKPRDYTIADERIDRFELFYASLNPEEQKNIDAATRYFQTILHRRGATEFGPRAAKELMMALVDHLQKYGRPRTLVATKDR